MSGQGFRKTSERTLARQVLDSRNGQWLYRYQIRDQIQLLDQRFSEQAINRSLEEMTVEGEVEKRYGPRGGVMFRSYDESRPVSTKTGFDELPIRGSSRPDELEWPE